MHSWRQRVEGAANLQEAQHLVNEPRQVLGIGETAEHVGNDLEFSKLLGRILPQTLAGEIPYAVTTEARGPLSPPVGLAILYRHRDGARLIAGPRALFTRRRVGLGCVVVQYGLPVARSDIQPSVRATQPAERVAEAGRKKLRVVRKPSTSDVTAGNVGAPAPVDFFLLVEFLVQPRFSGFL